MSRADELAAKAARIKAKQGTDERKKHAATFVDAVFPEAASPAAPTTGQRRKAVVLAKPVRVTVDLAPTQHRALQTWTADAAETLGRSRVTKQDVLTALVARLLNDPGLADQIITDLGNSE
ncbi:hypothetical protein [Streptosporangium sp. NBC_01469]|uniref:hypothetical protein n=1 Tax=Streptosporangium sp. NBC_01469 TaxID=2903898 RepID=UPI002E2DEB04|nr:hypothetical protein [Streptosporangium sp. NBC_01469]